MPQNVLFYILQGLEAITLLNGQLESGLLDRRQQQLSSELEQLGELLATRPLNLIRQGAT